MKRTIKIIHDDKEKPKIKRKRKICLNVEENKTKKQN